VSENELVTVFETRQWTAYALAKSVLDSAGIDSFVTGEHLQGLGEATGPLTIQVARRDASDAAALVEDLLSERDLSAELEGEQDA
jgi:hypothetical protein